MLNLRSARNSRVRIPPPPQRKKLPRNFSAAFAFKFRQKFITRRLPSLMFYYTYILKSQKNNSLYIGYTSDLKKRLKEHNSGKNQATRPFRPYVLIFYEAFLSKIDAQDRERYLKGGYGRKTIKVMIKNCLKEDNVHFAHFRTLQQAS